LANVTMTQNRCNVLADGATGGGILAGGSVSFLLNNSIVAGNLNGTGPGATPDDIGIGQVDSRSGYNLIGTGGSGGLQNGVNGNRVGVTNPGLAPLGDYGGPTQTMALSPGSPALGAGSVALAVDAGGKPLTADQRGFARVVNGAVDIGALETQPPPTAHLSGPTVSEAAGSTTVGFTLTASDPTPGLQGGPFTYTVNWGDGTSQTVQGTATGAPVSHTYTAAMVCTVSVTAQDQGLAVSPPATATVVVSTTAGDKIILNDPTLAAGQPAGAVWVTWNGTTTTYQPTDQVVVSGSGGSDTYTVNFGSTLTTPLYLFGGGANSGDTLIANGDASSTNVITKAPGQITWGNPVTETVYRSGTPNTTINANGTSQNYVNDPGSNTIINGGPGTNNISITATTGNGVVINGGPHANNYLITMGNLLGPVTINSTAGTSTVTVNAPAGSNVLTLSPTQLTGDGETINFNLGSTATQFTVSGGAGNNNQLVVQGSPPGPLAAQGLAPTVGAITAPLAPTAVNIAIAASAAFTNLDGTPQTAVWNWGDGTTSPGGVSQTGATGTVTGSHSYATDGVFTITLTVTDSTGGGATTAAFQYAVIYNPSAGFVTGGGWFNSPAGAYAANPALTGQANFGLNAKYKPGATVPTGNTEFQLPAAGLNFHATSYDWLVITTNQAQYQGSGTINGAGSYGFLVTAQDDGGATPDLLRLQIWDKSNSNAVVYDTQPGAPVTAAPATALGGGRIQVHTNAQLAAGGASIGGAAPAPLTAAELRPVVQEAIARWQDAGISPAQVSALSHVAVGIAEFPGPWLGMAFPGAIWIDQTAAGYGWYIDPTPADDSEFPALPGSPAYGKMDLLTVVEHELGHELGYGDNAGSGLMGVFLGTGERRALTPVLPAGLANGPVEGAHAIVAPPGLNLNGTGAVGSPGPAGSAALDRLFAGYAGEEATLAALLLADQGDWTAQGPAGYLRRRA
jgi:hypothetical protein